MNEDLKRELALMSGEGTEAPSTESVETEAPSTEAPTTEAPEEEEEFETEAPSTDAPEEEETNIEDVIAGLMEDEKTTKAPPTKAPTTSAPLEDVDFVAGLDMEDLTSDPKIFNQVLNKVFKAGLEKGQSLKENVLRSVPDVIKNVIVQQTAMQKATDSFYKENEDLTTPSRKKVVGLVAQKIMSKNPEYDLDKLLMETGKQVREILKLKKEATSKKETKPDFGKKTKGKAKAKPKPKLTGMQKELQDMLDAIE